MKVSELQGAALDWAVAKCEGDLPAGYSFDPIRHGYSTKWALGGQIIEREYIQLNIDLAWIATRIEGSSISEERGATPLIAAMRCYVASRLGDEVTIPEELR